MLRNQDYDLAVKLGILDETTKQKIQDAYESVEQSVGENFPLE